MVSAIIYMKYNSSASKHGTPSYARPKPVTTRVYVVHCINHTTSTYKDVLESEASTLLRAFVG